MATKVAINGFGRIGRLVARARRGPGDARGAAQDPKHARSRHLAGGADSVYDVDCRIHFSIECTNHFSSKLNYFGENC